MAGYVLKLNDVLTASLIGIQFCYSCHISVHNLTENALNHTVTQHSHYAFNGLQLFGNSP